MGWTYLHKDKKTKVVDVLRSQFEHTSGGTNSRILECKTYGRTAYLAYRDTHQRVHGLVVLLDYQPADQYNFGYKDIVDTMGPLEDACPESILKKLSPLPSPKRIRLGLHTHEQTEHLDHYQYGRDWRARCWRRIRRKKRQPKIKSGDLVIFDQPVKMSNGKEYTTFQVVKEGRRTRYYIGGYLSCRLTRRLFEERTYQVKKPAA